ncbi:S8 family peptidase [Xanthomonas citri]|uniref:S8 family peptidase n=1 Tax=Xanthomonas citri TaxID=346 RepID=UPI000247CC78|nr:S8 family peptidase [Xanthomonas citri]MBE0313972.1 S8 family serine peptidase [Xanthomonas citri pv. punicae]MDS0762206.1 S8 family serine peptidase [Xanthomonas citri pv. punicae]MDS0766027.1 S8 family serine peptidase [Xanthomonas citri pv. punicae]MDS0800790.1 S8 family serine peptidase [Xanthomonas citri pv. punicae]MDS0833421.1 S8 family serine peptidase [Xanthomonas citri pv. punicae]
MPYHSVGVLRRVAFVCALSCTFHAAAGEVNLQGLNSSNTHQRFIVSYKNSVGSSRATGLSAPWGDIARAVPQARGKALGLSATRRLSGGPMLLVADRKLDRVDSESLMRRLAADPAVKRVEVDILMRPLLVPNDPGVPQQWAMGATAASLNIRPAWDRSTGKGIVVAVIDTGITNHPDLAANVLPGYDFIVDPATARDGTARDANAADQGDWAAANECGPGASASNSSWHGTHVAGIVAAVGNNAVGVVGTAFNAKILPLRVLGRCGGYMSDIADAIVWASGGKVTGVPANPNPATVINLSLGTCSATLNNAITAAVTRGSVVVVAAGNSNMDVSTSVPANCANVIAVAATTSAGAKASFSNFGKGVDIAAPGQSIVSTLNTGTTAPGNPAYVVYSGTSMAAPHVAGVVALMQSVALNPLTPATVKALLKASARPMPVACTQGCGAGLVNADGAVAAVIESTTLSRNVARTGLSAALSDSLYYQVNVPAGTRSLKVTLAGGSGNADLSVRAGALPTDAAYSCRSMLPGNGDSCTLAAPAAGVYYVRLKSTLGFSGVSVTAAY